MHRWSKKLLTAKGFVEVSILRRSSWAQSGIFVCRTLQFHRTDQWLESGCIDFELYRIELVVDLPTVSAKKIDEVLLERLKVILSGRPVCSLVRGGLRSCGTGTTMGQDFCWK